MCIRDRSTWGKRLKVEAMSNNSLTTINIERSVADHRVPYDLNYSLNKPVLTSRWYSAWKNRVISNGVYYGPIYYSAWAGLLLSGLLFFDSYWRQSRGVRPNLVTKSRKQYGERFLLNHRDELQNLGRWNHNFACWEAEPYCGNDFDLPKEERRTL
eukprot:TRINITY_DN239_c0_g1_i5.p1 TRINITY_DN239_c0_g1~~TRINITY_DN239_c0_g1_i5.p1  ORF type:complete len:156 (-),score=34.33 TRINITY_DN239_c0_g1_i5:95-562(-)